MPKLLKNLLIISSLFIVAAIIGGCTAVVAPEPVGRSVTKHDAINLTGLWEIKTDDHLPHLLYVKQSNSGKLLIASVQLKDGQFQFVTQKAQITKNDGSYYLNSHYQVPSDKKDKHKSKEQGYTFARIIWRKNTLIAFPVNAAYFRKQIKSGTVKGHTKTYKHAKGIFLDLNQKELNKLIQTKKFSEQFDLKKAIIFHRIRQFSQEN